jgi:ADP-ribose pyrophosphatase YjhB (NUDIX family)
MYQIFFDQRSIVICSKTEDYFQEHGTVTLSGEEYSDLSDIPEMFDTSTHISKLYIPSDDPEKTFRKLASHFTEINAAGGAVENPDGELLFIFRNGVWDLPKGKQEDGEDIALTALREVEEECGIKDLKLGELLCITYHTYHRDGKFYLKHTYWYKMENSAKEDPKPQLEEEITSAVWVKRDKIVKCMENTYPSIKAVIGQLQLS